MLTCIRYLLQLRWFWIKVGYRMLDKRHHIEVHLNLSMNIQQKLCHYSIH